LAEISTADPTPAAPGNRFQGTEHSDYGLPVHPVCNLLPLMGEEASTKLTEDIKEHGLIEPIVLHEGEIVDGRNWLLACRQAGVKPRFVKWTDIYKGPMPLSCWIWSVNIRRRHLSGDQIAVAVVEFREWELHEAARLRQIEAGKQQGDHGKKGGRGHAKPLPANSSEGVSEDPVKLRSHSGDTRKAMAKEAQVSEYKIGQVQKVKKHAPELLKDVKQGKTPLRSAARQAGGQPANAQKQKSAKRKPVKNADAPSRANFNVMRAARSSYAAFCIDLRDVPGAYRDAFVREYFLLLEKLKSPVDLKADDENQRQAG
jgi:hypothetical protein